MTERVSTGIPGLDNLIEGGIPNGSVTLISGGAGTGKTTFCSEFLLQGLQNGEKCLFLSTEELPDEILSDAKEFGWDFEAYEDDGLFRIEHISPPNRPKYFREDVQDLIDAFEPDRIVIDSISVFGTYWENKRMVRSELTHLLKLLRDVDVVTLLTAEIPDTETGRLSRYGIAEFVVDGVIKLELISIGRDAFGTLEVRKMRKTAIEKGQFELNMDDNGLSVGDETLEIE